MEERDLRIPRLYAAASLKLQFRDPPLGEVHLYSAALCRGLIEARDGHLYIRLLLHVFRGFMPRPH